MKRKIFAYLALGILLFSCKDEKEAHESVSKFVVTSPLQMDTTIYKEYVAQIRSANHVELRSQEKGYLEKILVDEGQFVKKGQLMFKLMPLVYQAEVEKATAEMNFAEIEYKNTRLLEQKNVVSANELALAKAKLDKAQAELSLAKAHLGFTEIRAPFDGIMNRYYARLGGLIEEGELITTLSDNKKMWVYFNVAESEYLNYAQHSKGEDKQKVLLKLANQNMYEEPGVVETIEADFNNETGNIAFRAGFSNNKGILRHGETGNILMPVVLKDAVIIPQKATYDVLDKKYVYVVENDILKARQINVAYEIPHLYILASGLSPNEKILAEGLGKVKNNEKIASRFVPMEKEMEELKNLHAE